MRHALLTVALCSLFMTGCQGSGDKGDAGGGAAVAAAPGTREEISGLHRQYRKALLERDMKTLDRLWADDLTFINPAGQLRTKAQRMADVSSGATAFDSIDITDESLRMYCNGGVAVNTSRGSIKAKYSGRESSGDYRVTAVWARPKGAWQIVAIHMTPIQQ